MMNANDTFSYLVFISSIWNSFMSHFNLHPLTLALFATFTTTTFANTTSQNSNTHQLSTIVVSASGFEQDLKDAPASISVITKEDIEKRMQPQLQTF